MVRASSIQITIVIFEILHYRVCIRTDWLERPKAPQSVQVAKAKSPSMLSTGGSIMNLVNSALLGTAAVLTAAAGAQAADLPSRKAAPVAYVKICDVYGRGFYYIPGTNTCLKVGGRVRFELGWRRAQNVSTTGTTLASAARTQDTLGWRSRAYVNMDARTQTAYGTVQTVLSISLRSRSGIFNGGTNGAQGNTTASPQVYAAYIRFAGFTFGRAPYVFSNGPGYIFYWTNYSGGSAIGTMQLAYTAVLGGGMSATIALEDKSEFATQNVTQPNRKPNIVLTLRADQGWGFVRASAAYGWTNTATATTTWEKSGWAVGADAKINMPMIARGDALYLRAAYGDGLLDYVTGGNLANGSKAKDGRITGGYQPGLTNFYTNSSAKAWSAMVAFTHFWSPTLRSNIAWSYLNIDLPASAGADYTGSRSWQASHQLVWSPTSGFNIGLEVYYAKITHDVSATRAAALAAIGVKRNPDDMAVKLRVERTF